MPKSKKKMGRPVLPKGEAMDHIVPVRLNAADFKRIESLALASRQTVSEWIRSAVRALLPLPRLWRCNSGRLGPSNSTNRRVVAVVAAGLYKGVNLEVSTDGGKTWKTESA